MENYNNQNQGNEIVVKERKKYSKAAYCILVLLFGGIGIHAFYAGRVIQGIVFLIFGLIGIILTPIFGIGLFIMVPIWIINIIQLIMALSKQSDMYGRIS